MTLKRILAIIAVILLIGMYAATFIFSLSDSPYAGDLFKASIFCTAFVPILLYGCIAIAHIFQKKKPPHDEDEK